LPGIVPIPYVITKREAEQVVLDEIARGLDAVIVEPGLMFGPWDWKPSSGKMMIEVVRFAPWYPVGAITCCDVRDVAAGILAAARLGRTGRRYVLGGHNVTYKEAWQRMARIGGGLRPFLPMGLGFRALVAPGLDLATRLRGRESEKNSGALRMAAQQHCFSSRRAEDELGYRIRPFDQSLRDTWDWFRQHGYI